MLLRKFRERHLGGRKAGSAQVELRLQNLRRGRVLVRNIPLLRELRRQALRARLHLAPRLGKIALSLGLRLQCFFARRHDQLRDFQLRFEGLRASGVAPLGLLELALLPRRFLEVFFARRDDQLRDLQLGLERFGQRAVPPHGLLELALLLRGLLEIFFARGEVLAQGLGLGLRIVQLRGEAHIVARQRGPSTPLRRQFTNSLLEVLADGLLQRVRELVGELEHVVRDRMAIARIRKRFQPTPQIANHADRPFAQLHIPRASRFR